MFTTILLGTTLCGIPSPHTGPLAEAAVAETGRIHIEWLPPTVRRWSALIDDAARTHGVDPELVALIVMAESAGKPEAVSPTGARGLMQLMPSTADQVARDLQVSPPSLDALLDPRQNLELGAAHLAALMRAGDIRELDDAAVEWLAVAYNGGLEVADAWQSGGPVRLETQRYRKFVLDSWQARRQPAPPQP